MKINLLDLNIYEWFKEKMSNFSLKSNFFIEILFYLFAGFMIGFLLKHFGRYIVLGTIFICIMIWIFNLLQVVSINYEQIQSIFGIYTGITFSEILNITLLWIKNHIYEAIAGCIGFYLALEIS